MNGDRQPDPANLRVPSAYRDETVIERSNVTLSEVAVRMVRRADHRGATCVAKADVPYSRIGNILPKLLRFAEPSTLATDNADQRCADADDPL